VVAVAAPALCGRGDGPRAVTGAGDCLSCFLGAAARGSERRARWPRIFLFRHSTLNMLARQHLLSEEEIVAGCSPPMQRRVTTQIMCHVSLGAAPHRPGGAAQRQVQAHAHASQHGDRQISRVSKGEPGHSILQHDMPDNEESDGEDARQHTLEHGPLAHPGHLGWARKTSPRPR